jgi:hypothetical protein
MKLYKSPTNEVWAYEPDGSQDNLIPKNFIAITEQEANQLTQRVEPTSTYVPTKEQLMAELQALAAKIQAME